MFIEEISYAILKYIPTDDLCKLRYVCSQFDRIAKEIIDYRYIKIDDLSISPFLGSAIYRKESSILHQMTQSISYLKCNIVLFEIDKINQFACLNFSFERMNSPDLFGFKYRSKIDDNHRELTELLCLMPQLYIVSFEPLKDIEDHKNGIEVSPQYMRIEKIHHIQTAAGIEISVRTEINEFSNFNASIKVYLFELNDLKDKKLLAPFIETVTVLSSIETFHCFKKVLETQSNTFKYHVDATRVKFNESYDYTVIRKFTEVISLPSIST